uniref:Uncharacterized protein n=1 Tax=Opuntia streptacantha TaxID=393608 RepID=A0A7C9DU24_OPUST
MVCFIDAGRCRIIRCRLHAGLGQVDLGCAFSLPWSVAILNRAMDKLVPKRSLKLQWRTSQFDFLNFLHLVAFARFLTRPEFCDVKMSQYRNVSTRVFLWDAGLVI